MDIDIISTLIGSGATLVVGFLTLWGVQISESKQLKRDGENIKETKGIVSETGRKVENIHSGMESIKPDIAKIEDRTRGIDFIAKEMAEFKGMKSGASGKIEPEKILAAMTEAFHENYLLKQEAAAAQEEIQSLREENERLTSYISELESTLQEDECQDLEEYELGF